ncbi:MAG TPA: GatB/YqeY domain-containing protein [Chloroflexi bacterium]|nr:GatB/YqeY domain-containing protein [Chloroflexota bacterium]
MTGLRERLQQDLHQAMRSRDERRKAALRMVIMAIQFAEAESARDLDDADIIELIRREVKRREEAVSMMREAGREDRVAEELPELEILKAYLPAQLDETEIRALVQSVIEEVNANSPRDFGKVMGAVMPRIKGRADGRVVSKVARELLSA